MQAISTFICCICTADVLWSGAGTWRSSSRISITRCFALDQLFCTVPVQSCLPVVSIGACLPGKSCPAIADWNSNSGIAFELHLERSSSFYWDFHTQPVQRVFYFASLKEKDKDCFPIAAVFKAVYSTKERSQCRHMATRNYSNPAKLFHMFFAALVSPLTKNILLLMLACAVLLLVPKHIQWLLKLAAEAEAVQFFLKVVLPLVFFLFLLNYLVRRS